MKRMSRLADPTGLAAPAQRELAAQIRAMVTSMLDELAACYTQVLRPRLAEHGIRLVGWDDLDAAQRDEASAVFESDISPVLTPLSMDAAHPFPYVSNLSTSGVPARGSGHRRGGAGACEARRPTCPSGCA
jgi:polyphosphate kinase